MATPLLLLHGAIGAKTQFTQLAAALGDTFEVHTLDFEGHGAAADAGRPFRMQHFVENVVAYMDANDLAQIDIFGHSMGGYVGLLLAAQQPERVRRVFTLGLKFAWTPEFGKREIRNMNPDKILEKVPRFAQVLEARHMGMGWVENMRKSAEMTLDLGHSHTLTPELLTTIQQPVVIGLGDRDKMTTINESVAAYQALPNGALQIFPKTQHPLERINIAMLAAAITHFFGN